MPDVHLTKYELAHRFCPICYSASHWATTSPTYSDTYNQNDSRCIDCGWGGKVHDRISREEALFHLLRKAEAENAIIWGPYDEAHKYCPRCGYDKFSVTLAARHGDRDTNSCCCGRCGWEGIVHDLIASPPEKQDI